MLDLYVIKEGKRLRCGYTTGSCATAAAKAAAIMLETGNIIQSVEIDTPANIRLKLEVCNPKIDEDRASCAIIKDAGDDPDSTDGMAIYAAVRKRQDGMVKIEGGIGIGRILRKGLFGEIGQAAINPVPLQMMEKEVREVSNSGYDITIFAPQGEIIAKKTFNANMGIEGGISIIGTKGIVYPMSEEALIYYLALMGAPRPLLDKVNGAITAEEGLNICIEAGYGQIVQRMERGAEEKIRRYLKEVEDLFEKSQFVKETIGVYSVSEPCAYLLGGQLLVQKSRHNGITISITKEDKNG